VLDLACLWANAVSTEANVVKWITEKAYTDFGKEYDLTANHIDFVFKDYNFTEVLKAKKIDCTDMATVVYLLSRLTGVQDIYMRRIHGPFFTNDILPTGPNAKWDWFWFINHYCAWYDEKVFDACLQYNKPNPYIPIHEEFTDYKLKLWDNMVIFTLKENDWKPIVDIFGLPHFY